MIMVVVKVSVAARWRLMVYPDASGQEAKASRREHASIPEVAFRTLMYLCYT